MFGHLGVKLDKQGNTDNTGQNWTHRRAVQELCPNNDWCLCVLLIISWTLEEWENIINTYHWFLFLFIIKEWNEDKTSKVCLKMDMKAAMVLMISVQDIIMRRCGVIEVNNVDQVIYLNIGMRMRNRLKLQEIYIQEIRRRFAFLLNQIEKLKFFSTFNLEHRSSCSTKVHISNVLFYRYVAANYLAVSKTMEQESSHQARGWVYCD